jgi:4-amino-4-deoxy-L-arabinose transferase-like glycosyltransferase
MRPLSRPRRAGLLRRGAAWFVTFATGRTTAPACVIWFATVHAVLWTVVLTSLKAAQDVHMDVAEAFAWGQKFQLGYGKHPPLSGWIAGLWFNAFPVRDWSTYALAMVTVGVSLVVCWYIAVRVVDRRRAFLTVLMLAIYPIFNFKGFKYNADLLQLVTLPLIVLAYLNAFEKRSAFSGFLLGLAAVAGLMTKYWAVTIIGAVGIAALLHPDRLRFLASPAPWVAIVIAVIGMIPHMWWVVQVDFAPFTYAGDVYKLSSYARGAQLVVNYIGHNIALLLPPLLAALIVLRPQPFRRLWQQSFMKSTRSAVLWVRNGVAGVDLSQARNIRVIQTIVAVGPPVAALVLLVYIKTDWGIPLFFLVPLAFIAVPQLGVQRIALPRLALVWLAMTLITLIASPLIAQHSVRQIAEVGSTNNPTSQFALQLTGAWHQRFRSRWAVVAGTTEVGELLTFYSPDHPAPFTPGEIWSSGLTSFDEAKRLGFIGICDTTDNRLGVCEAWMDKNAPNAERLNMTARRFFRGKSGPTVQWKVYIVPPGPLSG